MSFDNYAKDDLTFNPFMSISLTDEYIVDRNQPLEFHD